jgi:hypothetical protein
MNYKIANLLIVEVLKSENREILTSDKYESPLDALNHILTKHFNNNIKGRPINDKIIDETKLTNEVANIIHLRRLTKINPNYRLPYGCRDDYNYDLD